LVVEIAAVGIGVDFGGFGVAVGFWTGAVVGVGGTGVFVAFGFGVGVGVVATGVFVAVGAGTVAVGATVAVVGGPGGGVIGVGINVGGGGGVLAAAKVCAVGERIATPSTSMPAAMGNVRPKVMRLFIQDSLRFVVCVRVAWVDATDMRQVACSIAARRASALLRMGRPARASLRAGKRKESQPYSALDIPPFAHAARYVITNIDLSVFIIQRGTHGVNHGFTVPSRCLHPILIVLPRTCHCPALRAKADGVLRLHRPA
jgi:hypothetical protein